MWSRGDDWIATQVYWKGWSAYEPETARVFYLLAQRADVVLDVGAHVGFYTLLAAHANPGTQVHAFEPMPVAFARLRKNVELNGLNNVVCVPRAAGSTDRIAEFFIVPGSGVPSSSSLSKEFMTRLGNVEPIPVPLVTLDHYAEEDGIAKVDLVKIDTETTEPDVLRGMLGILRRDRPHIICEVLDSCETGISIEKILRDYGYRYFILTSHGPEPRGEITADSHWRNYLFTAADSPMIDEIRKSSIPEPSPTKPSFAIVSNL